YSQEFLYELVRLKGRGGADKRKCHTCSKPDGAIYRCRECCVKRLVCKECCLAAHGRLPLHIIREWDGERFRKVTLRSMGLRVYLGHEDGSRCFMPRVDPHPLVVMHVTGLHEVSVRYCNCLEAIPRRQQLLRFGWYPATVHRPATCATLQLLDLFHGLTLNGKLSAYNFYKTLVYITDALGIKVPKVRSRSHKISTCSGFKALAHADAKWHTGMRSTGVMAVCCSRHEMVCSQAVGNLQKGERYCNADYVVCSALQDSHDLTDVLFSYDIACQWIINFLERMEALPEHLQLPDDMELSAAIPKGHCPGHQLSCQIAWAMGIQVGVGRTDGEAIERLWAFVRMCASSIKEMGPGSRADTLDDQFGFHNWCKLIGMGTCLVLYRHKAKVQGIKQTTLHEDFTAHLPSDVVARWTEWVEAWEKDKESRPNPYAQDDSKRDTEAKARYRIRERERLACEAGEMPLHDTSPCGLLTNGFLIEEHQAKLRLLTDGEGTLTHAQASDIQKKRVALARRIRNFRTVQLVYMPGVQAELRRESVARTAALEVEDQKLWLPSDFSADKRSTACLGDIAKKEAEIRKGQCHDALQAMRDCERALRTLAMYRRDETDGQGVRTRAQTSINTIEARRNYNADRYRCCRRALERLEPGGSWRVELRPLREADVTNMTGGSFDIDVLLPMGQGETELSWVWATETGQGDDVIESCRVEWLKSRARSMRWSEERKFLAEEVRRTPITLEKKALWWDERRESEDQSLGDDIKEGIRAYSAQQAAVCRMLSSSFKTLWDLEGVDVAEDDDEWE
ncbi:hypothetical protein BDZ89DRAFT_933846, partial [Hymenopellis radicata]